MDDSNRPTSPLFPVVFLSIMRAIHTHFRDGGMWTLNQLLVMAHINVDYAQGDLCTQGRIAKREGLNQQTVHEAVLALAKGGWIDEQVDPEDHRRRLLRPSDRFLESRQEAWRELAGIRGS